MIWHYLKIVVIILMTIHGLAGLKGIVKSTRQGELRRIWNWPMRIAVGCWLFAGVTGCIGSWIGSQHGGAAIGNNLGSAAIFAFIAGIVSLGVFLAGFLVTVLHDIKPKSRPAPAQEDIDQIQALLEKGRKEEAVKLYQQQNQVSIQAAEETIDAIEQVLQAGLRI